MSAATSPWDENDFCLAYLAAFAALGIDPGGDMARELASLTRSGPEMIDAVVAMRRARAHQRVFAALDLLRAKRAADEKPRVA